MAMDVDVIPAHTHTHLLPPECLAGAVLGEYGLPPEQQLVGVRGRLHVAHAWRIGAIKLVASARG
jgi:hypothetical protein